jgi:hypothetical protein
MAALTPIEIGLTTAIVAVTNEEPQVLVAGETVGRFRAALAPHLRDRAARMGGGADRA